MIEYKNRYGDVFTFTKQKDGSVLWEGNFEFARCGYPNVYKMAYQQYRKDGGEMHIEDFIEAVHEQREITLDFTPLAKKYGAMVISDTKTINMVDPSGGPYLTEHIDLGEFFSDEFDGLCIRSFSSIDTGYRINTYAKFAHLEDAKRIGGLSV